MRYEVRTSCDCCGSSHLIQIENYDKWSELHIVKCKICGYAFVREIPPDDEIMKANSDFFGLLESGINFVEIQNQRKLQKKRVFQQVNALINKYSKSPSFNLLDIGCSYGSFLSYIKNSHNSCTTNGIDLNPVYGKFLCKQGHNYYTGFFEDINFSPKFDMITALEVFEHLKYPNKILRHAWDSLNDDGLLIFEVPNFLYQFLKGKVEKTKAYKIIFKKDTWGLMPHIHLNYFSPRTLSLFFQNNGFEVIDILTRDVTINTQRYPFILKLSSRIWTKFSLMSSFFGIYVGPAFIIIGRKKLLS